MADTVERLKRVGVLPVLVVRDAAHAEPLARALVTGGVPAAEAIDGHDAPGTGRILAVEDDPAVLSVTLETLSGLGYQVTTAADAKEALELLGLGEPVDLLFSDVMMPGGVDGVALARQAQEVRPELKILLTSGYVGEAGTLDGHDFPLIAKPYDPGALASKIRAALGPA